MSVWRSPFYHLCGFWSHAVTCNAMKRYRTIENSIFLCFVLQVDELMRSVSTVYVPISATALMSIFPTFKLSFILLIHALIAYIYFFVSNLSASILFTCPTPNHLDIPLWILSLFLFFRVLNIKLCSRWLAWTMRHFVSSATDESKISVPWSSLQGILYTPWVKKTRHQTLIHNFNYYPIFKIFSLATRQ